METDIENQEEEMNPSKSENNPNTETAPKSFVQQPTEEEKDIEDVTNRSYHTQKKPRKTLRIRHIRRPKRKPKPSSHKTSPHVTQVAMKNPNEKPKYDKYKWNLSAPHTLVWTQQMQDKMNKEVIAIPDTIQHFSCSGVKGIRAIHWLPDKLITLICDHCPDLEMLPPQLPPSLAFLDCHQCEKINSLPIMNEGLEILICHSCPLVYCPKELPQSIEMIQSGFRELDEAVDRRKKNKNLFESSNIEMKELLLKWSLRRD
jgi:hypothetical protein